MDPFAVLFSLQADPINIWAELVLVGTTNKDSFQLRPWDILSGHPVLQYQCSP
jgi:hypothetical protein